MSRRYISELEEGELVEGVFLVRSKDLREARSGALFIKAVVADRTGSIDAVMWDRFIQDERLREGARAS